MKKLLKMLCFSLVVLGFTPVFAEGYSSGQTQQQMPNVASTNINWSTDYGQAVQMAQQSRKPILLFFTGSDWCGWCKKMEQEIFASPEFAQAMGNSFIFVKIDFPMNTKLPPALAEQNNKLKQKYGITGYPTVVILNSSENILGEGGYQAGGGRAYAGYLKQFLQ